ncbi:MAG: hypothetical protein ACLR23_26740 [Clostridia bacterium]
MFGDIREAAIIDGCSDFRYLVKILIPLSVPIMAVLVLYHAVGHWNSYFNALLYLRDTDLYPLQMVLRNILIMNNASMDMLASDPEAMSLRIKMIDFGQVLGRSWWRVFRLSSCIPLFRSILSRGSWSGR